MQTFKRFAVLACVVGALLFSGVAATWNWDANNNLLVGQMTPGTLVVGTSTGGAQANSPSLPAAAGKTNYVQGFSITGLGATSATSVAVTLSDGTNTLNFTFPVVAGATTGCTPLVVNFEAPLPASAANTAWTLTVGSFGSGNTAASANIWGFKL
jgi:hypothetical protein